MPRKFFLLYFRYFLYNEKVVAYTSVLVDFKDDVKTIPGVFIFHSLKVKFFNPI